MDASTWAEIRRRLGAEGWGGVAVREVAGIAAVGGAMPATDEAREVLERAWSDLDVPAQAAPQR
ncbi:MAG: hypothetical protein H6744_08670 [Deltaproteobacteria bacterium]|nr:hypothetical protein [Deltaproteobacteria bacterium]MCB9786751.1 hypothetical protein [Deltaproteobacteria bacterium]